MDAETLRRTDCDVVILGSGLAGATFAAILARHGARVVLIDSSKHPRFAIGESMTPHLVAWLELLAERYHVPEIRALTSIDNATRRIGNTFGVKRNFGFQLHHPGREPDPTESRQFVLPRLLTSACHLFRQDSDAYMFRVAVKYGVTVRQGYQAVDVDVDEDGVTVELHTGDTYRGRYLVDASGFRSPLSAKFDLREKPPRFQHHSRSLFTHMIGVRPYDDVVDLPTWARPPIRWHEGTMHHLFERGWFWIIPFDNYKDSRNPMCSVGLTLDSELYPRPEGVSPEEDFYSIARQFPAIARQLVRASPVREWVSTDRLQYSSTHSIGYRWCLMSHAAGFVDPLFSLGLSNTFEVMNSLAWRVIAALADDDFSVERFAYVEQLEQGLLDYNNELVNCAYISWSDVRLWDAVFRVWGSSLTPAAMRVSAALGRYRATGDERHLRALEDGRYPGLNLPTSPSVRRTLDVTVEMCEKYEIGEITAHAAAHAIVREVRHSPATPMSFGWADTRRTFIYPSTSNVLRYLVTASRSHAPEIRSIGRDMSKALARATAQGRKVL